MRNQAAKILTISIFGMFFIIISFSCNNFVSQKSKAIDSATNDPDTEFNKYSDTVKIKWTTEPVFKVPESVIYDEDRDAIYVSNINGGPSDQDDNGFISKLNKDGEVIELEWVNRLHAPKGMAIYGNKLYVSDIVRVAEIDIDKAQVLKYYDAKDAEFLNDVAAAPDGRIFISDIKTNQIYSVFDSKLELWLETDELNHPNGLFVEGGNLMVGSGNAILAVNIENKEITVIHDKTGSIDGLESDARGNYIISDWKGNVNIVYPGKDQKLLVTTEKDTIQAADIDFAVKYDLILVPTFYANRITAYELIR